ncbi:pyrroloquinoline quinone precursor peptide PqqA [Robbsia betulipollinis]|uniref:pyrroloquinoline quinone precursor peptide PqqA n=1 Tax=Robbsia betulipollinis TaxID=2981849 RepID=UPI003D78CB0B
MCPATETADAFSFPFRVRRLRRHRGRWKRRFSRRRVSPIRSFFFAGRGGHMQWVTPSFVDMRLGFEITMYVFTR